VKRRLRGAISGFSVGVFAVVFALLIFGCRAAEENAAGTEGGSGLSVRVIAGDRDEDIELAGFPAVAGRVAYEGPSMVEGEANWKEAHDYRGVALRGIVERAADLDALRTITVVALDGWRKTLPVEVLEGETACGTVILAISVDDQTTSGAPLLVFLPGDERFSNEDMMEALGPKHAHYFGERPSTTGLLVSRVFLVVLDYDGGPLPTPLDL
jgi:hypothetical protein